MTFQPAHKDTVNPPGQIVNEVTLGDYIARKSRSDAFAQVANEKKLTFEEWFKQINAQHGLPPAHIIARWAWKAAQENK